MLALLHASYGGREILFELEYFLSESSIPDNDYQSTISDVSLESDSKLIHYSLDISSPSSVPLNDDGSEYQHFISLSTHACVKSFVSTFTDAVRSSKVLSDVLDLSKTTPAAFSKYMYEYIYASALSRGMPTPQSVAKEASIVESSDTLALPVMINVFANSMGKYLHEHDILNQSNAADFAVAYANKIEENAKQIVTKGDPMSKVKALAVGYEEFLESNGLLQSKDSEIEYLSENEEKGKKKELEKYIINKLK
ncbi:RP1-2 domain-containing protein [Nephila pilipes]|uniref:RP1-2 domain-containing protein n=1 Tax=Nephila pilipes TaxID=299642 RepID=A0A8X6P1P6_NEPPI|nr:RP1-2 domain-containing protein [Nephila pilipes]